MDTNQHGFVAEIRNRKTGKYRVVCRCGAESPKTTKARAYDWYENHTPFGTFARVMGGW